MNNIRNFAIIAHIDHGKTTLASFLMKSVCSSLQKLDYYKEEMARGITIRSKVVTIPYENFFLNMIDTPGHPDFRSQLWTTPIQGALLLIDSQSGIQGQTFHHCHRAISSGLSIIPVITKIDKGLDKIDPIINEMKDLLGIDVLSSPYPLLMCSSKTGENISSIIPAIIERIPSPPPSMSDELDIHIMSNDSPFYTIFIKSGTLRSCNGLAYKGILIEDFGTLEGSIRHSKKLLTTGMIGFIKTKYSIPIEDESSLPPINAALFTLEVYPGMSQSQKEKDLLLQKIKESSLTYAIPFKQTSNAILGCGISISFQGSLQADIFKDSFADCIWMDGKIEYLILWKNLLTTPLIAREDCGGEIEKIKTFLEPLIPIKISFPPLFLPSIKSLLERYWKDVKKEFFSNKGRIFSSLKEEIKEDLFMTMLWTNLPQSILQNFLKELTITTQGFAIVEGSSQSSDEIPYQSINLSCIGLRINGISIPNFSLIVPENISQEKGKSLSNLLKSLLPQQQYHQGIQAISLGFGRNIGNRVLSRENISAFGKDVTAKCYGGDLTRKAKLLEHQKKGKEKLKKKMMGGGGGRDGIKLDTNIFINLMGGNTD